jgi:hypothetical protein
MTAFEWNLLKSATERVDAGRRALNEEQTATALSEGPLSVTGERL